MLCSAPTSEHALLPLRRCVAAAPDFSAPPTAVSSPSAACLAAWLPFRLPCPRRLPLGQPSQDVKVKAEHGGQRPVFRTRSKSELDRLKEQNEHLRRMLLSTDDERRSSWESEQLSKPVWGFGRIA